MTIIGKAFKFIAPKDWNRFQERGRYIFQGPNREELIVSAALVQGPGATAELITVRENLFRNAEQSLKRAALHPALRVTRPFQKSHVVGILEHWTLFAETEGGDALFYQSLFCHSTGVLTATLEGPSTKNVALVFEDFARSVEAV
jgi:hypothetical protein